MVHISLLAQDCAYTVNDIFIDYNWYDGEFVRRYKVRRAGRKHNFCVRGAPGLSVRLEQAWINGIPVLMCRPHGLAGNEGRYSWDKILDWLSSRIPQAHRIDTAKKFDRLLDSALDK